MVIKKFFDATADGGGLAQTFKAASWDGTEGAQTEESNTEIVNDTEGTAATAGTEGQAAETTKPDDKAELGKPEIVTQTPAVLDWAEAIKTQDKKEVLSKLGDKPEILKALGMDDKLIGIIEHFEKNGDLKQYLKEVDTDYAKMSDDDIIKESIRREKPDANEKQLEVFYKKALNQYILDDADADEMDQEVLNYDKAQKVKELRSKMIEDQQKFILPTKDPVADAAKAQAEADKAAADKAEQYKQLENTITADPYVRQLLADKKVKFGEYNFEVDPSDFVDYATGKKDLFSLFVKPEGGADIEAFMQTIAWIKHRKDVINGLVGQGKTQAFKEDAEQPDPPARGQQGSAMKELSALDNLSKNGKITSFN